MSYTENDNKIKILNVLDMEKVALKNIEEDNVSDMEKAAMKDILKDVYKVVLRKREKEAMKAIVKDLPEHVYDYELTTRGKTFLKEIEEDKKRGSTPKVGAADHLPAREKAILKAILKDIPKASVAYSLTAKEKAILKEIEEDMKNDNKKKKKLLEQFIECEGDHANPHFDDFLLQTHLTGTYLLTFIIKLSWSNIMIVAFFHIFCLLLLLCMNLLVFFYDFTIDNSIIFSYIRATFDFMVCPGVLLIEKCYGEQCDTDLFMASYFMIYNVLLGIFYHPAHSLLKRMMESLEQEYGPEHFL